VETAVFLFALGMVPASYILCVRRKNTTIQQHSTAEGGGHLMQKYVMQGPYQEQIRTQQFPQANPVHLMTAQCSRNM
jgi:hypothetical protein